MTTIGADPELGAKVSFRKTMTVAEQAMFTGISGNLGPVYVDAVKARRAGAEGVIAFELAVAALATTCLARLGGDTRRIGELSLRFLVAVLVGRTVEARAEIIAINGDYILCRIVCLLDGGSKAAEGEAKLVPVRAAE